MTDVYLAAIFLLFAIGFVVLQKTYSYVPAKELKRRAENHDPIASKLYPAAAYGSSLRILLLAGICVCSSIGFIFLIHRTSLWLSLLLVVAVLWLAFSWLPATRVTKFGLTLTGYATPAFTRLMSMLYPLLNRGARLEEKHRIFPAHTGLFERDDLLALIDQQEQQADNRFSPEEISIIKHTLLFESMKVSDSLTPRKQIKTVLASDIVGPILINELHELGQDYILVSESPRGAIIGVLAYKKLNLHSKGRVRDVMDPTVYYVHEQASLREALHAFFVTSNPLFIVINSSEESIGVLTIQDILRTLLGHIPGDDFDQYADKSAVVSRYLTQSDDPVPTARVVHSPEEVLE